MNVWLAIALAVGQIGQLMGGTSAGGGSPGGGYAIVTEASSPLTTESNSTLVTQAAP